MGLKKPDNISPKTQHFLYTNLFIHSIHNSILKFHTKIPYLNLLLILPFFLLLLLFDLSSLLLSSFLFWFALAKTKPKSKNEIFLQSCLSNTSFWVKVSNFSIWFLNSLLFPNHLFIFPFSKSSFPLISFGSLIGNLPIYP